MATKQPEAISRRQATGAAFGPPFLFRARTVIGVTAPSIRCGLGQARQRFSEARTGDICFFFVAMIAVVIAAFAIL
jgi:hypothetical protein